MVSWAPEKARAVSPDPKPAKRQKASTEAWEAIRAGFADATCVHCGLAAQSLHHIVPKSQGGDDVPENLAPLCGDGTRGCHGLIESHGSGWERVAASVRPYVLLNRPRCVYVIGKIDWDRFNARYPLLSEPGSVGAPSRDSSTGDRLPTAGHDLQPGSENTEKPRRGAWEMDWLPDYRPEDIPFG